MSDNPRRCPSCGVDLPANAPDAICPRCLLRNALAGDGPDVVSHEVSVSFEPGRTSVLASLAESIGGVPQVLLRDTDPRDDASPVVRPASPEMPGTEGRSSRYQFLGEIARGGMGAVLKGRDPDLGRDLAIKVLLEAHRDKPELIRRFIEEAQIGGQLQHPGIVPVYELGSFADRRPFFSMKLVKGRTLASLLAKRSPAAPPSVGAGSVRRSERGAGQPHRGTEPPPTKPPGPAHGLPRFLAIFESVCQTMAYAHARGVIHRDLKPSNVMVGSFGEVQVMDWGLAKVLPSGGAVDDQPPQRNEPEPVLSVIRTARAEGDASQAGSILGTPGYMAPEQARGEVELVDERADVFGLGAILCEILTGEPAFTGRTVGETQRKAARGDLAEAFGRLDTSGADPDLIALAKDCLASERDDRPRQAGQVATQMTAYLTGVQERLRNAELARVEANARADEERKRRLLTVALAASILALVTLGGVAAAWQSQLWQAQLAKVETTLARIQTLRDQAAKDGANSDRWETVLDAADEARGSLGTLAASEPGRRLAALRAKIADDQKRAERDRKLIDELSVTETSVENNSPNLDRRFAEAFERYELDLETTAVKDAIAHLASRPDAFVREVVGGLDRWLVSRHDAIPFGDESQKKQTLLGLHRLLELVKGLDPDQERNRLRALLEQSDLKPHRQVLRAMANQAEVIEFGPSTALLLARILTKAEDEAGAIAVLRAAVIRYPADAWTNFELATLLNRAQPRKLDEAIRYYTVARALRPDSGWDLAQVLQQQGRDDEALALDRELVRRNPKNDGLFMIDLLRLLRKSGRVREAISVAERKIAPLRDRLRREPNNASDHCELGRFLWVLADDRSGAIAEVREAARIEPKDPSNHKSLGLMLLHQGDLPGSIAAYGAAIRVNPSDEELHYNLAWLLERCGDRKGQIAELRAAIRAQSAARNQLQPSTRVRAAVPDEAGLQGQRADPVALDEEHQEAILQESLFSECVKIDLGLYFFPYDLFDSERGQIALGTALAESGDLSGAIGAYLEAIRLGESGRREGKAAPHVYLGSVRRATGDLPGAIASYREAIRLDPEQSIEARYGLGTTLAESRDLPGAIAAFREAIRHDATHQLQPGRLLRMIVMAQRPEEAVTALGRVGEQAHDEETTGRAIDVATNRYRQLSKVGVPIPRIFRLSSEGRSLPAHYYDRQFFAASAAHWFAFFATDPKLADVMMAHNRYNAACSAALAADGYGFDNPPLDDQAKARWRRQALEWLKAALAYWAKQAESDVPAAKARIGQTLKHWTEDSDLDGIRADEAVNQLAEDEQKACRALWKEVDQLLKKTGR